VLSIIKLPRIILKKITPRSAFEGPILVTGAAGFIGSHLVERLRRAHPNTPVIGIVRRLEQPDRRTQACELTHLPSVKKLFAKLRPSLIFHAAGKVRGPAEDLMRANLLTSATLFHALEQLKLSPRIVILGSAAEYGDPANAYTWSKRCETGLAQQKAAYGHDVVIARPFNIIGPRLSEAFLAGTVAKQIAENRRIIVTGPLNAARDFVDVRDVTRALMVIAQRGKRGGAYEICSGRRRPIREIRDVLFRQAKQPLRHKIRLSLGSSRAAVERRGNPKALFRLGWKPLISFSESLHDTLNYYRSHQD
jgi:GDP-4-dehydro-6-deoxy-D-mannose reductase